MVGFTISVEFPIDSEALQPSCLASQFEILLQMQAMADVLEPLLPMICGYCPVTGDTWISFGGGCGKKVRG